MTEAVFFLSAFLHRRGSVLVCDRFEFLRHLGSHIPSSGVEVHAGYFRVSTIHRTLTWATVSLTYKRFQLHFLKLTTLLPPYFKRPYLDFGVRHGFETDVNLKLVNCLHFLLVSITQDDQTDTLSPFCQSWSHCLFVSLLNV